MSFEQNSTSFEIPDEPLPTYTRFIGGSSESPSASSRSSELGSATCITVRVATSNVAWVGSSDIHVSRKMTELSLLSGPSCFTWLL